MASSTLGPGTRLGVYEILGVLGEGGMGAVYRARDTKLGRDVAIKVLLPSVANDSDRLARFEREAKTLAALNHPHIAQIYGLEERRAGQEGQEGRDGDVGPFLVLELVEGQTLADRIARGPIPLDEALAIAKQIADALEAAHEQGIIHRDLKPANIKVRDDGTVKVLDFGLAKAIERSGEPGDRGVRLQPDLTNSPTITSPAMMTGIGMVLGTAAYMAPEQAKGRPADKRCDTWAFGCVLYEMLTGTRAFTGDDVGEVMAEVIKVSVDWHRLDRVPNAALVTLVRRCLRKEPRQRPGDGGAVRLEIDEAIASPASAPVEAPRRPTIPLTWAIVGGGVAIIAAAAGAVALRAPVPVRPSAPVAHVALPLPSGAQVRQGPQAAISPDGTEIAYVANRGGGSQLYVRAIGDFDSRLQAGTQGASAPFFSPDGKWVGFFANGTLKKISVAGGVVVDLAPSSGSSTGGSWRSAGTIVFSAMGNLSVIDAGGGAARDVLSAAQIANGSALYPEALPGGDRMLVTSNRGRNDTADGFTIDVLTVSTGERRVLVQGGVFPKYLRSGHLVFLRGGSVMAVPFDADTLETKGTPVEVLKGVRTQYNGVGAFSCSDNGNCIYVAGSTETQRNIVLVDRGGTPRSLPLPPTSYAQPRFSPTGDRLLYWLEQARCDVVVVDLARGTTTRLTSDGDNHYPAWMPGGQRISYISSKLRSQGRGNYQFFSRPASGGGAEEMLVPDQTLSPQVPMSWAPDGTLVYSDQQDLWTIGPSGDRKPHQFTSTRFTETTPAFSPDGRWLAYVSDESGRFDVYVQPYPGPGDKYVISTAGGTEPVWARDGKELFYRNGDQMMAVDVQLQPFHAGRPKVLFTGAYARSDDRTSYDVAPNGDFVMLSVAEGDQAATQINLLMNWFDELKARVPVGR